MKLLSFISTLVVLLLAVSPAKARLGETLNQLTARYGPPTARLPETPRIFHKGGWIITVSLINGVSVGEKFQKSGGPNTEDIAQLLSINSQGQTWTLKQSGPTFMGSIFPVPGTVAKTWIRDDGALATLTTGLPIYLNIESKVLLDAEAADKAAQEKAKQSSTQGF
jgi:hypothetical protein